MGLAAAIAVGAVGSIASGAIASKGASKAADAQVQAAQDAAAAQERMYAKQVELQEPFRQAGLTAQSRIMELLGLPDPNKTTAAAAGPEAYGLTQVSAPWTEYGGGGTYYVDKSGNPVSDINAYMQANPLPASAATPSADFGKYAKDFSMADFEADPGYQFRQDEGMKALERSAAARGLLQSGSTLKGIQRFSQGLASQEYTNAFNRYNVNRANQLNPLQSLMGAGQSAANTLTNAAGVQGTNEANTLMAAGQARASGYVGSANAMASAISGIGQAAMSYPLYQAQINWLNSNPSGRINN